MKKLDYNASISANITAKEAYEAINSVSKWWTGNLEGSSNKLNDVFTVHFGETFSTHKIVELDPDKKVVWYVTDCNLDWIKNKKEWKGTKMSFEISTKNKATHINFTHIGIVPGIECYDDCSMGWDHYIKESLFKLITKGQGVLFEESERSSR